MNFLTTSDFSETSVCLQNFYGDQGIEIRFVVPAPFMLNTPFQRANILKIVFSNYLPYTP